MIFSCPISIIRIPRLEYLWLIEFLIWYLVNHICVLSIAILIGVGYVRASVRNPKLSWTKIQCKRRCFLAYGQGLTLKWTVWISLLLFIDVKIFSTRFANYSLLHKQRLLHVNSLIYKKFKDKPPISSSHCFASEIKSSVFCLVKATGSVVGYLMVLLDFSLLKNGLFSDHLSTTESLDELGKEWWENSSLVKNWFVPTSVL